MSSEFLLNTSKGTESKTLTFKESDSLYNMSISETSKVDALWIHGWDNGLKRCAIAYAKEVGVPVLMRGKNTGAATPDGWNLKGMAKRLYLSRIYANCSGFLYIGSDNRRYYKT